MEEGEARLQFDAGGLTGVLLDDASSGPPTVDDLFDALAARHTIATSGPRPALRVAAIGADGLRYLPGEVLPADALPAALDLDPGADPEGYTLVSVSQVGPGGALLARLPPGATLPSWDPDPGDWTYLRLEYQAADGTEERVWVSPWFAARRCGCATGLSVRGGGGGTIALLLVVAFRRRSPGPLSERKRRMV